MRSCNKVMWLGHYKFDNNKIYNKSNNNKLKKKLAKSENKK